MRFLVVLGAVELVIIVGFLVGWKKRLTYGGVLVLHAISTLSSYQTCLSPFEGPNILFFAAWPMRAAGRRQRLPVPGSPNTGPGGPRGFGLIPCRRGSRHSRPGGGAPAHGRPGQGAVPATSKRSGRLGGS